ncbi:MAG: sterol desaturase family protein [Cytophagales bacterium]|nr:sterol desaturase family protein [Cytophagales bacterium]MDW8383725.1 sterol desaturase family protein [Flammeovirgaceae bacterium]
MKKLTYPSQDSQTARLFKNSILERLTRTHIAVPLVLYYGISIGLLYFGFTSQKLELGKACLLFAFGFLGFTLFEYLVHRFAFHIKPDTPLKKKFQYNFHGVHHDYPKDKERLVMPPIISIVLAFLFFILFYVFFKDYVFAFLPGFLSGYATYLIIHYAVHVFAPPKNFLKILWIHHSIHHYKDSTRAFGVSSPLWDYVFGTMPKYEK